MNYFSKFLLLGLVVLLSYQCSKKNTDVTDIENNINVDSRINEFVWKAMDSWYYWEGLSPILDLTTNSDEWVNKLNSYSNPGELFNDIKSGAPDRFSWIVDDYEEHLSKLVGGVYKVFGFTYSFFDMDGEEYIVLRKIELGSNAKAAGLKRGDIVSHINGTRISSSNLSSLTAEDKASFRMIKYENNQFNEVEEEIVVEKSELAINPIQVNKVIEQNGVKIGYLLFNSFLSKYNLELNNVFSEFKTANIEELVLDFRFNGGGSVSHAIKMVSLIYGDADESDELLNYSYNSKKIEKNISRNFDNKFNVSNEDGSVSEIYDLDRLTSLKRIFVLTGKSTASASELVINCLRPYFGDENVIVIGEKTIGKGSASVTLFDIPENDYTVDVDNNYLPHSSHKWALQPIVLLITNQEGKSVPNDGFIPDYEVFEKDSYLNLMPLGDESESLLRKALDIIDGSGLSARGGENKSIKELYSPSYYYSGMYLDK